VLRDHLAAEVFVTYTPHVLGGEVSLRAIALDGVSAARLQAAIGDELARLRAAPASDDELAGAGAVRRRARREARGSPRRRGGRARSRSGTRSRARPTSWRARSSGCAR